jgi:DnaK suppressor protein
MFDADKALRDERTNLVHQLSELGANEAGELRDDVDYGEAFADAASATAERTEVIGLVDSVKRMLDDVDVALERLADGSYGTCAECGKEIGKARIEFRPESIYCVDCKSKSQ